MDNYSKQCQKKDNCFIENGFINLQNKQYRLDSFVIKKIQRQQQQGILLQSQLVSQTIYGDQKAISKLFEEMKKYSFQLCLQDHYRLRKLLGECAFGKIYKAIHRGTNQKFAIKKLLKDE